MDFNAVAPANTSPEPDTPRTATGTTEFERQLSGTQAGASPHGVAPPVLQGEAYSPYRDAGHSYSPYLGGGHLYPPYLDLAHPYSPDLGWQDDLYALGSVDAEPAPEHSPQHLSQQTIAQAIEEHPFFDQDLIWQNLDVGPSHAEPPYAGPSQAGPSHAGPSRTAPLQAEPSHAGPSHARPLQAGSPQAGSSAAGPPELSEFRMLGGDLAKDYWVFTGQTATGAQIDMLERSGVKPSKDHPTVFTILGVPHTAEWREEDFIRLTPSLDPTFWPEDSEEDQPADPEDSPIR
ncbi:hypothetical protein [Bradyrhizobium sp. CCBAU 53415]|uniref:hypothetical protein n=1 Tax=Bradyrhizobium sp. CCBAU 53415 TaxID=1325119 RepID=UPI0023066830|nr:hypothetical protein [Bradyrhizobium sp. CCBAU 53415]